MSSLPIGSSWRGWLPSRPRGVVIFLSLLVGAVLLVGSHETDGWLQSVLINVGTAVLLVAPLTYVGDFLLRRLDDLNASLRSSTAGLSAIRNLLPPGEPRTTIFDQLLDAVKARAADGEVPFSQIAILLAGDSDDRTVALAAMVGAPSLVDGLAVLRSIRRPGYGNEQYYALCAAHAAWQSNLTDDERGQIIAAIAEDDQMRKWIENDTARREVADQLRAAPPPIE